MRFSIDECIGFVADGEGLTDEWWADVKARRPKAHAFKGRLPWPPERKLALLVGEIPPPQQPRTVPDLLTDAVPRRAASAMTMLPESPSTGATDVENSPQDLNRPESRPSTASNKRKRSDDLGAGYSNEASLMEPPTASLSALAVARAGSERRRTLSQSVQQSSQAAAGMARGFQELVGAFQQQAERYRQLELSSGPQDEAAVAEQRGVLLAIARSLEQSTRATADVARGYHDLVRMFVREADSA